MPRAMDLLTPFYSLNLVSLPEDYQTLVKEYYSKQCRNCLKQLQQNAICLLCGEILCLMPKDNCCGSLPGMLSNKTLDWRTGAQTVNKEGELSYHARVWEGGCSAFLLPSSAEVIRLDSGRAAKFDSFYRNNLGEEFNENQTKKWENFYISEETGGKKVRSALRSMLVRGELPNRVVQERQRKSSVIRRHIY